MSSTTYKICSKCGAHLVRRENVMTTSYPSQYIYDCPECGNVEYDIHMYPCGDDACAIGYSETVDYKAKYEEALEKARVIYKGRKAMHYTDEVSDLEFLFPELAETYDEMMIEAIIDALNSHCNSINHLSARGHQMEDVKAWLEKRKINTEGDFGRGYDSGYQAGYAVAKNEMQPKVATATLDSEKQKERVPENEKTGTRKEQKHDDATLYAVASDGSTILIKQKSAEWSEKEKKIISNIRRFVFDHASENFGVDVNGDYCKDEYEEADDFLKSLYSQPKQKRSEKPCLTCDEYDKGYKQGYTEGCTAGYNKAMLEHKSAEPSIDELQRREDEFYNFKVFAAKQAKEHHISFVHDFEWNNFCAELLSYFNEQQKPESASASIMIPSCWEEMQKEQQPRWEINNPHTTKWTKEMIDEKFEELVDKYYSSPDCGTTAGVWSEEDEKNFEWFDKLFRAESVVAGGRDIPQDKYLWFKSLRPQPKWKPSEEQMAALKKTTQLANFGSDAKRRDALLSLYEQLKKLMED